MGESLLDTTIPTEAGSAQSWLARALFAGGILTIGLDQYRPLLGSVGNLADLLFGAAFILGACVWFAQVDSRRLSNLLHGIRRSEALIWGGVLLTAGGAIASLGSAAPSPSWRVTLKYFTMFCLWLPWVTVTVEQYLSVTSALVLYVGGFCLIALGTFSDLFLGTRFGVRLVSTPGYEVNLDNLSEAVRYGGPTGHPNTLGYVSAIGFLLCLSAVVGGNRRRLLAPLLGLLACGGTVLISGSRAAFLGVVVAGLVLLGLSKPVGRRRLLLVGAACLCALWIGSSFVGYRSAANPVERLLESVQPHRSFEADWQRARDLLLVKRLLSHDPVTGYGMEDIGTGAPPTKVGFNLPHFIVLQSWVAGGVLALLGTLWLYAVTLRLGWTAVREGHSIAPGLFAACVAFMLMDMVHPGLDQRFKWFAAALMIATLHSSGRSSRSAQTLVSVVQE